MATYPCHGSVWLEGGPKIPAVIYGTWNGFAVATVPKRSALRMLARDPDLTIVDATTSHIKGRVESMGTIEKILVGGGRLLFGPGWSLLHSCSGNDRRPPPLPERWRRLCGKLEQ